MAMKESAAAFIAGRAVSDPTTRIEPRVTERLDSPHPIDAGIAKTSANHKPAV
jgi:hypothetical protein